jgi:hypothetical protein
MSGRSQESQLREWEMLLLAARSHEIELAGIVAERETLETAYSRARATRAMRETLQASSRDASRRLKQVLASGHQAAVNLRRIVKSRRRIG